MQITFMGAAQTVTGSFHLVETDSCRFAIDCGMFQGSKAIKEFNYKDFPIGPDSIDFVILTHAHVDHCGLLPKLVKKGFKGKIYCTKPTKDLLPYMLADSAHVQEAEVERKNRKAMRSGAPLIEPIYDSTDAENAAALAVELKYNEKIKLHPEVTVRLRDAGHILGSAIVELWLLEDGKTSKVVFSGDLGQLNQPIINDPEKIEEADYIIMESTYGNRNHNQGLGRTKELSRVIHETMQQGGNLIIPSFALERTQDLLYDLFTLYKDGELDPKIDVYIDSPLAITATKIFQQSTEFYDEESKVFLSQGENPLCLPNLKFSMTQEDSMRLNEVHGNTIIISASGMCDSGRIKHHLKHNLWRPESTVLFVGYQAEGSLGRRILEGEKTVRIHGEEIQVKANIRSIEAFSAHADQTALINWLKNFKNIPKEIILVHGEEDAQTKLAEKIKTDLHFPVIIPKYLDSITLECFDSVESVSTPESKTRIENMAKKHHAELLSEELYLKIRHKLNVLYSESEEYGDYDTLIKKLEEINKLL